MRDKLLDRLVEVARVVAWQSGESEMDTVGTMASILHNHPEWIPRFMAEGAGLFIDVGFGMELGSLNWRARNGQIVGPEELHEFLASRKGGATQEER